MYCPDCGGHVQNGICKDCQKEISKDLLKISQEEVVNSKDKKACYLAYIFWPLCNIFKPEDVKTVKFHRNQGFTLFIIEIITIFSFLIPSIGNFIGAALVFWDFYNIYKGINNVYKKTNDKIPLIGDFVFLN